jgi:hypothetical protein
LCFVLRCPDLWLQREFCARRKKDAPHKDNITRWYRQFVGIGCLRKGWSPGRTRVSDDNIERVREVFQRSSRKSVSRASRQLGMAEITVWKVLRKWLCFKDAIDAGPYTSRQSEKECILWGDAV